MSQHSPHRWWQASLGRRVLWSIMLASALVTVVLLAQDFLGVQHEFHATRDTALTKEVDRLAPLLASVSAPRDVAMLAHSLSDQSQRVRQEQALKPLLIEVRDKEGRRLFDSGGLGQQALIVPGMPPHTQRTFKLDGRRYRVAQTLAGPWVLALGEPHLDDGQILKVLAAGLLPSIALAFPLVLLPVWLAVRQGLRPLRQLSARMASRPADDLSPLQIDMRYAELRPVVVAFNEVLARLREKVARERAFVQDAAHELRTPMAVIAAQAHVLARAASEAERLQAEGALESAIERASHLAQQLLALASLDDSRPAAPQAFDLAYLLQDLLAQAQPQAQAQRSELWLDAPEQLPIVADRPALQSILLNLIDNALRHGQSAAPRQDHGQVGVTLQRLGEHIVLTVADDGPGIPLEDRQLVLERFVRGKGSTASGTGLGLAIVKQAAQRLGAELTLGNGLNGRGLSVTLRLPMHLMGSPQGKETGVQ